METGGEVIKKGVYIISEERIKSLDDLGFLFSPSSQSRFNPTVCGLAQLRCENEAVEYELKEAWLFPIFVESRVQQDAADSSIHKKQPEIDDEILSNGHGSDDDELVDDELTEIDWNPLEEESDLAVQSSYSAESRANVASASAEPTTLRIAKSILRKTHGLLSYMEEIDESQTKHG